MGISQLHRLRGSLQRDRLRFQEKIKEVTNKRLTVKIFTLIIDLLFYNFCNRVADTERVRKREQEGPRKTMKEE